MSTTTNTPISNFCLKGLLEKDKLTGLNFMDWLRHLRIVLRMEGKIQSIEVPLPEAPGPRATQALRDHYESRLKESNEVACLMLATMIPELQKGMEILVRSTCWCSCRICSNSKPSKNGLRPLRLLPTAKWHTAAV